MIKKLTNTKGYKMILIVSKSKKKAENYSEPFISMGYVAHGVTSAVALNEISPLYRAVIILDIEIS